MLENNYSILRREQYRSLSKINLAGDILDIGGTNKSDYHKVLNGVDSVTTLNINPDFDCDIVHDIQKDFPIPNQAYDGILSLNVFEHVKGYSVGFREIARIIKSGGKLVISTPFLVNIHGSPDDYHRYTDSFYRDTLDELGFEVLEIKTLGFGLFSLVFQAVGGAIPFNWLRKLTMNMFISIDKILLHFKSYQRLRNRIPLGFFVVAVKK